MTIDRYTKVVLTVIAVALSVIAINGAIPKASALGEPCGGLGSPCYVSNFGGLPLTVKISN
jgi:hypothetical protein